MSFRTRYLALGFVILLLVVLVAWHFYTFRLDDIQSIEVEVRNGKFFGLKQGRYDLGDYLEKNGRNQGLGFWRVLSNGYARTDRVKIKIATSAGVVTLLPHPSLVNEEDESHSVYFIVDSDRSQLWRSDKLGHHMMELIHSVPAQQDDREP